jgi:prepilin-type N-terminal cleavage/methylation domain-containing protein
LNRKAFSLIELSIVIIVVLVLITGLIKSSSLIYKTKLLSARSRTQNSPVSSINNLVLWMEATTEGAILNTNNSNNVSDGDYVLSWTDINAQMPFPLVFTSSSGSYPIYRKDATNGIPAIEFDGVNDYLDTPR